MPGRPSISFLPEEPWMAYAECQGKDSRMFFPPDGHNLLPRPAIEICNICPVQLDCLAYALEHRIDDGVWGGTTRNQRRRILRTQRALRLAKRYEGVPESSAYG